MCGCDNRSNIAFDELTNLGWSQIINNLIQLKHQGPGFLLCAAYPYLHRIGLIRGTCGLENTTPTSVLHDRITPAK